MCCYFGTLYRQRVNKRELKLVKQSQSEIAEKEQKLSLALWASGDVLWSWDLKAQTVSRENADDLSALYRWKSRSNLAKLKGSRASR